MTPDSSDPGIVAEGVSVVYRGGVRALDAASFAIPTGTIAALVGINGSGKSTLFKAIMGFIPLAAGRIEVLGQPAGARAGRGGIAYVPQSEEVDWTFPILVEDLVMMGRYGHMNWLRRPAAADRAAVEQALDRVGMADFRHRQIGELSGGQKKRIFLARALAQDSRVILLDEPFNGVDVTTEDALVALLRDLRDEGRVMLVATHNLGSVPEYCDHAILLDRNVIAEGPTRTVFTRANLERAFGGALRHHILAGGIVLTDDERPLVIYDEETP